MKYPTLPSSDAKKILQAKIAGESVDEQRFVSIKGEGQEFDDSFIGLMRKDLQKILAELPQVLGRGDEGGPKFEAKASSIVHRRIQLGADIVSDPEFWIWLAVLHFRELVEWRYGNKESGADQKNYGIGAAGENFLFRLWLRAELALDQRAADKYHLAARGDVDFWRSHLFRQGYANVRTFARALIRFQYPDANPEKPRLKISAIRELAKRLSRLRTNTFFELLDEQGCTKVIAAEAARVEAAG